MRLQRRPTSSRSSRGRPFYGLLESGSSRGGTILFQNQCFLHWRIISSMGTPFVSGRKTQTKPVMAAIHAAKKRKIPYLREQSRDKKDWAMAKVKSRFTATVMLCPADLVSSGNISLGTVQPSGPQDHPNAATNRHTTATTAMEKPFDSSPESGSFSPSSTATATCTFHDADDESRRRRLFLKGRK